MTFGQYLKAQIKRDDNVGKVARQLDDTFEWLDTNVLQDWQDQLIFRLDGYANDATSGPMTHEEMQGIAEMQERSFREGVQGLYKARAEWRLHLQGQKR